jgi:hypothetical protein
MKLNGSLLAVTVWLAAAGAAAAQPASDDIYRDARMAMVQEIEQNVRETSFALDRESLDPRVMTAMATVPRHRLVPAD